MARRRFTRGMTRLKDSENGNILLITAALLLVLILSFAALTEYGRYFLLREKTQTAADAAALAAGMAGTTRWIEFDVHFDYGRWMKSVPFSCDPYTVCYRDSDGEKVCYKKWRTCYDHVPYNPGIVPLNAYHDREKDAPGKIEGFEYPRLMELRDKVLKETCTSFGSRYKPVSPNPCYVSGVDAYGPFIEDRWLEYSGKDQKPAAEAYFLANLPGLAKGGDVTDVSVHRVPSEWKFDPDTGVNYPDPKPLREDPYYPSVIVKAKTYIEKLWDRFRAYLGPTETNVCAQASTHYASPQTGKWSRPPDEACVPR